MGRSPKLPDDAARNRQPRPVVHPKPGRPELQPSRVRVLRPRDLVAFEASWTGLQLERDAPGRAASGHSGARLRAGAEGGRLAVEFSFQHVAELVNEPNFPGDQSLDLPPPVPARAARPSRLVFKVPAGETIDYSTAGLLRAMATLEPAVAPGARPAPALIGRQTSLAGSAASLTERLLAASDGGRVGRIDVTPAVARRLRATDVIEGQRGLVAANRLIVRGVLTAGGGGRKRVEDMEAALHELHKPRPDETAIEAPFRLILSPSARGGWAHATQPAADKGGTRVELWHSRLGVRRTADGATTVDESDADQRIVRGIWTRDRERGQPLPIGVEDPFHASLTPDDREAIVAQTAGTPLAPEAVPEPVRVRRLALSSLGAWLDLHAQFDYQQYQAAFPPLASWDHVAPMGRDQYVRVARPGYLFPLGHRAFLITITERKVVEAAAPQAALFQRRFIVLGDAVETFSRRDLPFVAAALAPLRTPDLKQPPPGFAPFWPTPLGETTPLNWKIDASDQDGAIIHLNAALLFVFARPGNDAGEIANAYKDAQRNVIPASGQTVAFAPALARGQGEAAARASAETATIQLSGVASINTAEPFMEKASVIIPAIQRLTPSAEPSAVKYSEVYKASGFGAANVGDVFLELDSVSELNFGSSEQSGGFVRPDVAVRGLARSTGLVADVGAAAAGTFDAAKLFGAGLPKLFGLFNLTELIDSGPLALAPKFLTEQLDRVAALLTDLDALATAAQSAGLAPALEAKVATVQNAVKDLLAGDAAAIGGGVVGAALDAVAAEVQALSDAVPGAPLDPLQRATFDRLLAGLKVALAASDTVAAILTFANGFDPGGAEFRTRMEWRPVLKDFKVGGATVVRFIDPAKALVVSVEARTSAAHPVGTEVAAQLSDFELILLPGAPLMRIRFDRLAFRGGTARRPEVDVVFGGIEFVGILGFIEVLRDLIPLDGFSDPPFLDVSAEGVSAGFTAALPNAAIGVMSLSNLALGADCRIPFLGSSVSVGFNFCTRERPFTLAVFPLGGGGFVGIRLSPNGLVLLEAAFEFGAVVAIDFGVASGSVSVMAGIYFRLEGPAGSLTGYLRIRGEVDVLSLISASIELYMALTYAFDTGKMIGEASIKVTVEVLFFSTSVSIRAQRTFAGSNGDPTARQMLLVDAAGGSAVWDLYWGAFAPAGAGA